jgi:cytochrome oxidase Cu insertion factor (SCO1/SenC/PrrC family)
MGQVPPHYQKDDIELVSFPTPTINIGYTSDEKRMISQRVINRSAKWEYNVDYPIDVMGSFIKNQRFSIATLEPGDSIVVSYQENNLVFSGKGFEKLQLLYRLGKVNDSLNLLPAYKTLSHKNDKPSSLNDYLLWNEFLNNKEKLLLPLIDSYRSKLSGFGYNNIKEQFLYKMELIRVEKFMRLRGKAQVEKNVAGEIVNQYGLTDKDLAAICDSTQNVPGARWLEHEAPLINDPYYLLKKLTLDAYREKIAFIKKNESDTSAIGEGVNYWTLMYSMGKKKYTGIRQEALLSFILWYPRGSIYYFGFVPEVEAMLADYYKLSTITRYQEFTRKYELKKRESYNAKEAPDFILTDTKGFSYTSERLKGKIAILDFWFTGCTGCVQMAPALRRVEEFFKNDTNVVFLNISVDRDRKKWMKSIEQGKYTSGVGINLFTGDKGMDHEMIKKYGIEGYPSLYLIDQANRVLRPDPKPDPRRDSGKALVALIQKQLAYMKDGPYVFHNGDSITAYSISGASITNNRFGKAKTQMLQSQTDILNKTFSFPLKQSLIIPQSEYDRPEKLLVLSDIEGNFDAIRKLLQANKIIDGNFNWIFGKGHLVFAGDMFDRGEQVTECLWLIYSLEEKAQAAGGNVHFILGNHEHMNLIGNIKYVQQKYTDNAVLIGKTLPELYNENSELGRWLRTKNVIEKIGDLLFIHGGISRKLNQTPVTVTEVNQLARPYYAAYKRDYGDERINIILSDKIGPLWYRGYYQGGENADAENEIQQIIDSTLQKFNVAHIITGHTIVADTISMHFGGKVINTDTRHAEGKSEALLIEASNYYRVNSEGVRRLLFATTRQKEQDYISTN